MRPTTLKPLLIGSGMLLLPLAGFAAFLLVTTPEDYRAQIINDTRAKTGAELTLAEPLHWQLWPFGITLGKIGLRNAGEQAPLLDAASAVMGIQPLSLFSGEPRISSLVLDGASITVSEDAAGNSNWDAILQKLETQPGNSLSRITLHDSSIILKGQGDGNPDELVVSALTLDAIDTGKAMPLTTAFSWSRQSSAASADKSNLLSQNTLTASISRRQGKAAVDFNEVQLNSEISSTLFPGNFKLLLQGDFSKEGRVLASKNARIVADYKNLTMAEPLHAKLSSTVLADFKDKTLSLGTLQFSSASDKKNATEISTGLVANWGSGEILAHALKLSTHLDNPLSGQDLPVQASTNLALKWPQGDMTLADLAINAGGVAARGQLQASLPALQSGLMQASLLQDMKLQGQLRSDAFDVQALLAALGLRQKTAGKTSPAHFSTDIEGRGDSLFLRNLTLTLEQSTLHTEVAITALGNRPAYALLATFDSTDISPVSRLLGQQELSGKMQASGKVQMQGESLADLLQSAQGESSVRLENGRLQGTNFMHGLLEKLGSYGSLMPELAAGANSNADKHTDIISLVASTGIDKGIIASKAFMVNLGKARIKGEGSFDAGKQVMDYTFNLDLDKSLFAARTENLQLPMQCKGNLAEEQLEFIEAFAADCKTDEKAVNEIISKNLIKRFSGR